MSAPAARREQPALVALLQNVVDDETRANGSHRAELMKLMVHPAARRRGFARALMQAAAGEARRRGRSTLVLDTWRGDPAEALYQSLGWTFVGSIPRYARTAGGGLDANAIYYLLLEGLAALSRNGLRYPIPPYGIQSDAAAGLAVSYPAPTRG